MWIFSPATVATMDAPGTMTGGAVRDRKSSLGKIIGTLFMLPMLFYVIPIVFDFFSIDTATYGIYMGWITALVVLNALLPGSKPNMFAD